MLVNGILPQARCLTGRSTLCLSLCSSSTSAQCDVFADDDISNISSKNTLPVGLQQSLDDVSKWSDGVICLEG